MRPLTVILLIPLILAASCNALHPRKKHGNMPSVVDGTVLWCPDEYRGAEKIVVWRTHDGGLMVYAGPEYTYQDATDRGISENRTYAVVTRWIEVSRSPLKKPNTGFGWRNPWTRTRYPDLIFREGQGQKTLEIFSNGNGGYLIVITVIDDESLRVYPPIAGEQNAESVE
jgi:hypothetical protein